MVAVCSTHCIDDDVALVVDEVTIDQSSVCCAHLFRGGCLNRYSTDAPKWGVREFKVPGKYRHSARRHHLLAARNSFAGLMRYVDTRSHQLATDGVGDGTDGGAPKLSSDDRAIRTQRSRTAELVNKTNTTQADELAAHFKTFQVYVPPIDPG